MKKISYFLTFFLVISFGLTSSVQADSWVKVRKCNWFYKQWKTFARVDNFFGDAICKRKDKSCEFAESGCYWDDITRTRAYAVGGDVVKKGPFGPFSVELYDYYYAGEVIEPTDFEGRDAGFSRILMPSDQTKYFITKPDTKLLDKNANSKGFIESEGSKPVFDEENHAIIIKNVSGGLEMGVVDLANDFQALTVSVTHEPKSYTENENPYEEEKQYLENLIWSSTAMLNNGRILMDGDFMPSNFRVTKNDGQKKRVEVKFHIDEWIIPIPKDISLDEVSINFGIDGGNLGYGVSEKFSVRNPTESVMINSPFIPEETFEFVNYPNPISEKLKIRIGLPYTDNVEVMLKDINGKLVKKIYEGRVLANEVIEIEESLNDLPSAGKVYFLQMYTRDQILVRKVLTE